MTNRGGEICPNYEHKSQCPPSEEPAVHSDDLSGEEGRLRGGQKEEGVCHVLRGAQAAQRGLLGQLGQGLGAQMGVHPGVDTLAEKSFGINKTIGDLAGPMAFAILMGSSRAFYGKFGDKINLERFMQYSAVLCMVSYLMIAFIPVPALGILGCAVCGLSVGIMWPGTFSMAAASVKRGGTALFALLALAGDVGCSSGPTYVGMISGALNDNLKLGIFAALIFPVLMIMGIKMIGSLQKYD